MQSDTGRSYETEVHGMVMGRKERSGLFREDLGSHPEDLLAELKPED